MWKRIKGSIPPLVALFGGAWLKDRALHVQEADAVLLAPVAQDLAMKKAKARGLAAPEAIDYWRSVEETQADYLTAGVLVWVAKL